MAERRQLKLELLMRRDRREATTCFLNTDMKYEFLAGTKVLMMETESLADHYRLGQLKALIPSATTYKAPGQDERKLEVSIEEILKAVVEK